MPSLLQRIASSLHLTVQPDLCLFSHMPLQIRNDKYSNIRSELDSIASEYDEILEIHGFIVYEDQNLITFDMIVDFDADREKVKGEVLEKITSMHPEFDYMIIDDYDLSD